MKYNKLTKIGFEIIQEEGLHIPIDIKFVSRLSGIKKRTGVCYRSRGTNDNYKIIVHTMRTRWFEDPNGRYIMKGTNKRYRKATIGEEISFDKIVETFAHEIAHLKFWGHPPEHWSYTQHILNKIKQRLKNEQCISSS